jgi:hypothetical protein
MGYRTLHRVRIKPGPKKPPWIQGPSRMDLEMPDGSEFDAHIDGVTVYVRVPTGKDWGWYVHIDNVEVLSSFLEFTAGSQLVSSVLTAERVLGPE